jgi:hypothetical protein
MSYSFLRNETEFKIIEGKRRLNKTRSYEVYTSSGTSPLLIIQESVGLGKKLMRLLSGDGMGSVKLSIAEPNGTVQYAIKKKMGPFETSPFRLFDATGNVLATCSNKIKLKDDSFIEILNPSKKNIFKSGLSHGRAWFPIHIYKAEDTQSDINSISGKTFAKLSKTSGSIIGNSGDEYELVFTNTLTDEVQFLQILTYVVTADYAYDNEK